MRVAVAGFVHETNTFSPQPATRARFEEADGWPPLVTGEDLVPALDGANLAAAGFLDAARSNGAEVVPLLWCSAVPSGPVTKDAYETIVARILEHLKAAGPVDAVYLDLHGAMVADHARDGDGATLAAIRSAVGPDRLVVASLDLHANVSQTMLEASDALVAFRTYPHVDMAETGRRTFETLQALLPDVRRGNRPARHLGRIPFLIPLVCQSTDSQPGRRLYAQLPEVGDSAVYTTSLAMGFPPADTRETGPSVLSYAKNPQSARAAVSKVLDQVVAAESEFAVTLYDPEAAIREALRLAEEAGGPVVIADTRDNPGAGGAGDTTGLLLAADEVGAEGVTLGVLADEDTARQAVEAGVGSEISVVLGGRSDGRPYRGTARVLAVGDGRFTATGPMFGGSEMNLGPMAALRCGCVTVAVSSRRMQAADRSMFRHVGIDPDVQSVVVVKSSVHFRADFAHAKAIIVADAPGLNPVDHDLLPYRHLRPSVRLMPMGNKTAPASA